VSDNPPFNAITLAAHGPATDPTPIFEHFRGAYGTELLTAAAAHLHIFEKLEAGPLEEEQLRDKMGLAERAATVLFTSLRAMGLLARDDAGRAVLTPAAREHLLPGGAYYVGDYIGLAADSPGVLAMLERLQTNRPAGSSPQESAQTAFAPAGTTDKGTAFIYRPETESAMEDAAAARALTLALAGRAKNVAPALAGAVDLTQAKLLLDVGGGTGIYSIACLRRFSNLRAIVWDRPEVLRVAAEFAAQAGVQTRLQLIAGDMFHDPFPAGADAILLSNILHDWDVPECRALVARCATSFNKGGQVLIHDVFLNDALDGPLPIALYSAALFTLTEGRAYSAAEYREWLIAAGLHPQPVIPTGVHCGLLAGIRPA